MKISLIIILFLFSCQTTNNQRYIAKNYILNSSYIKKSLKHSIKDSANIQLFVSKSTEYIEIFPFYDELIEIQLGRKGLGWNSKDSLIYRLQHEKEHQELEKLVQSSNSYGAKFKREDDSRNDLVVYFYNLNDSVLLADVLPDNGEILGDGIKVLFLFSKTDSLKLVHEAYWQN